MEITAKLVKDLRDQTGAGMMKCKEALTECKGNFEEAVDYLRKKGLASADKKSGRATTQGLIIPMISADSKTGVMIELNCETDFVARNEVFKTFATEISTTVLKNPAIDNVEKLQSAKLSNGETAEDFRKAQIAKIGENIIFGRLERCEMPQDTHCVADSYIHGDGKIGVLVQLKVSASEMTSKQSIKDLAHDIALQIAAMRPRCIDRSGFTTADLDRERDVIMGQIKNDPKNSNKPPEILHKIVEGRLDKYFKEFCLLEQTFIKDDTKNIQKLIEETAASTGAKIEIHSYRRWEIGEKAREEASNCCSDSHECCACCQ